MIARVSLAEALVLGVVIAVAVLGGAIAVRGRTDRDG